MIPSTRTEAFSSESALARMSPSIWRPTENDAESPPRGCSIKLLSLLINR